jgi:hypothetical protein
LNLRPTLVPKLFSESIESCWKFWPNRYEWKLLPPFSRACGRVKPPGSRVGEHVESDPDLSPLPPKLQRILQATDEPIVDQNGRYPSGQGKETLNGQKLAEGITPNAGAVSLPRLGGLHHRYALAA